MNPNEPHITATEAEQALLGAILLEPGVLPEVSQIISESDFFILHHQWIWNAMMKLMQTENQIDTRSLCWQLEGNGQLKEIGGPAFFNQLIHSCNPSMNATSFAEVIRDSSYRRRIIHTASQIATEASKGASPDELQTIAKSITEVSSHPPRMVWTAYQLCTSDLGEADWLVDGLLLASGVNLLAGEPAAGKSFLALDLALGITRTGFAWNNIPVPEGKVLYHYLDGSPRGMKTRIQNLCNAKDVVPPNDLIIDCSPLDLRNDMDTSSLKQRIREEKISLIIFDVLARFMPGSDENSVSDIAPVMGKLRDLATSTDTTILLIHHLNKNAGIHLASRIRGSSDILAAVDTALIVTYGANRKVSPRRVIPEKNREGELQQPFLFQIGSDENRITLIFEKDNGSEQSRGKTKTALATEQLLTILESNPETNFTRPELVALLDVEDTPSERTLDRIFSEMKRYPSLRTDKRNAQTTYQWNVD